MCDSDAGNNLPVISISSATLIETELVAKQLLFDCVLTHTISRVRSIMRKVGVDLREEALMIEDENGTKTLLLFETLPELAPAE